MYYAGAGKNVQLYYHNFVKFKNIMGVHNVSAPHTFVRDIRVFNYFLYEKKFPSDSSLKFVLK